ncbi:MAG: hypothetical protein U9Q74_15365, partial [Gemmatimonadota bacterium]|nr:hypothetical protein [Gemmatimonadota bacterium]
MDTGAVAEQFTRRLIRLKLWYAARVADAGELSLQDAVRRRTGLRGHTTFAGAPALDIEEDRRG